MGKKTSARAVWITALIVITVVIGAQGFHKALRQTRSGSASSNTSARHATTDEGGCTIRYDQFRNRNTMTLVLGTIHRFDNEELKMGASATVEQGSGSTPREIELLFDSTAERLRYGNSAEVRFIIDGRRVNGGVAYKTGGSAMRQVNERLKLTIPASRFLEIAAGHEVEMQIGTTEVTLRREDLQRWRDFAACMGLRVGQER